MDQENNSINNQDDSANPLPAPMPTPEPNTQPQNNLNPQPVQPGVIPPAPQQPMPAAAQTDTLGIVSIIMIFFIPFIGLILGAIGLKKANKEGYKNTLSKIGLIVNSVFVVLGLLFFVLWIVLVAVASDEINDITQELENQSQSVSQQDPVDVSEASFEITSQSSLSAICEASGWPSNATPSAAGNVVGIFTSSASRPDYYSSQYANLTEYEDVDYANPAVVDTVVCLTASSQEPIATVNCKLSIDDVEVDAPMYRRPFTATAYTVSSKKEVASFTVQPETDCPFFVSVDPVDNSFNARVDEESLNNELNKAL
jgi:hypothetical protein